MIEYVWQRKKTMIQCEINADNSIDLFGIKK